MKPWWDAHKLGIYKGPGENFSITLIIHESLIRIWLFLYLSLNNKMIFSYVAPRAQHSTVILADPIPNYPRALFLNTRVCTFVLARTPPCIASIGV